MRRLRTAGFGIACLGLLATCGPSDDCDVPDESCADEPGFFRVCIPASTGHTASSAGNYYELHECPGIEPVCRARGTRDHACKDKQKPEPCNSASRVVFTAEGKERLVLSEVLDLDADTRPDLVFHCYDQLGKSCGFWRSKQTSDGNFEPAIHVADPRRDYARARFGDVNGDGFPDLVTGGPTLELRLGGTAGLGAPISRSLADWDRLDAVRDLDTDRKAEIILTAETEVRVLDYDDGTLRDRTRFEIERNASNTGFIAVGPLAFADFTGAGTPDLFVAIQGDDYRAFRAEADTYVRAPERDDWYSGYGTPIDFDRDGATDLLRGYAPRMQRGSVSVETSNRDGTFTSHTLRTLPYGSRAEAADVNGDGDLDGIAVHGNGMLTVMLGDGGGELGAPRTFELDYESSAATFLIDLDADGAADLVEGPAELLETPPSALRDTQTSIVRVTHHACL